MKKQDKSSILLNQCRAYVTIARQLRHVNIEGARAYLKQARKCLALLLQNDDLMKERQEMLRRKEEHKKAVEDYRNFIGFDVNKAG